jgi:ABC-type sugar transport system ATPase subunit
MTIEPKSVTALIGPSGCGKSTFLRSINRMHEVLPGAKVDGQLLIDGQNIYDRDIDVTAVRRTIGMVFQRPNPFPTMSIYDNVVAGLRLNGLRKKSLLDAACEKALRGANLWNEVKDRLSRPGAGLSGGQQQRLCIARAIAVEPLFGPRPDLDAGHRGPHRRVEERVHDRHRDPQHAAGGAGLRPDRLLLDRQDRRTGTPDRVRRHGEDLHQPLGEAH